MMMAIMLCMTTGVVVTAEKAALVYEICAKKEITSDEQEIYLERIKRIEPLDDGTRVVVLLDGQTIIIQKNEALRFTRRPSK